MPPALLLATLLAALADDPTRPAMVALDFQAVPLPQVLLGLSERSGTRIALAQTGPPTSDEDAPARPITLETPAPVPFWEAIDRLGAAAKLRPVSAVGGNIHPRADVRMEDAPAGDQGLVVYAGPLRLDRLIARSHREHRYGPALILPGPLPDSVEFVARPEPRTLVAWVGPPEQIVAVDDRGRSLAPSPERKPRASFSPGDREIAVVVPIDRTSPTGNRLAKLSGVLPMELAALPREPAFVLPLAGTTGREVREAGLIVTIQESTALPNGHRLRMTARPDPAATTGVALRADVLPRLVVVTDEKGEPAQGGGTTSLNAEGFTSEMSYFVAAGRPIALQMRIYAARFVRWDAPFAFADVPLP